MTVEPSSSACTPKLASSSAEPHPTVILGETEACGLPDLV